MINIVDKSTCSGCTACDKICGHNAISMQTDEKGFLYPKVDVSRCVDCNLCDKVCPFHEHYNRYDNYESPRYYAMRLLNDSELLKSQSGGAFYILSRAILDRGGIIYGA